MTSQAKPQATRQAKFLHGPTMSHIITMTLTSAVGLIAVFSVDFIDLFFLSQLEDKAVQAALGFTGTILFATISIGIGFSIASSATVSRAVGEQDQEKTNRITINNLIYIFTIAAILAVIIYFTTDPLLTFLGAKDHVHQLALDYLYILIPTMPIFAVSISSGACLRALGDPMQALYIYITGAVINAALDPLFIFVFDMGLNGAALATAIARIAMMLMGLYGIMRIHQLNTLPDMKSLLKDFTPFRIIAIPAILTNLATPIGNAYVTWSAAPYGDSAVGAWAIITRIAPLAFAGIFALSGSVGPIMGQNLGAKKYDRVQQTLKDAVKFNMAYTLAVWAILAISAPYICQLMQIEGEMANLVTFYCYWLIPGFGMIGLMFIANASFNNLHKAHYSSWLNWSRATIGTIPFVFLGAQYFGMYGIVSGQIIGGSIISLLSLYICHRLINKLLNNNENH